ncbi:MAG: hypothetical protein Q9218_006924, partial [Villophora microphyllina]
GYRRLIAALCCRLPSTSTAMDSKLQRALRQHLLLLSTLNKAQDAKPKAMHRDKNDPKAIRRSFLDAVAYICDYEKGGKTCTAAALQNSDSQLTLWLTANPRSRLHKENPPERHIAKVFVAIKEIPVAANVYVPGEFVKVVQRSSSSRLELYRTQACKACQQCLKDIVDFEDG